MIKRYLDKLDTSYLEASKGALGIKISNVSNIISSVYFNENYKKEILENVKCLTFKSLYPKIILELFDEGYWNLGKSDKIVQGTENWVDDIRKYFEWGDGKHPIPRIAEKTTKERINRIFGNLSNTYPEFTNLVLQYNKFMMDDILEHNDNIIYYDTYEIYYIGDDLNLMDIDYEYFIDEYKYIVFFGKKNYLYLGEDGSIQGRGIRIFGMNYDEWISIIKSLYRDQKINGVLGIENNKIYDYILNNHSYHHHSSYNCHKHQVFDLS